MDQELKKLLGPVQIEPGQTKTRERSLRVREDGSGEIEILSGGNSAAPYMLKPLAELYGSGTGAGSVNPKDERFMPLMMGIEEEIARGYAEQPSLTDGAVALALGQLAASPESPPADPLAKRVNVALRLILSLNDYSRQEVRQALRHVVRSVERHTSLAGRRGYLEFIAQYFTPRR